MGGSAVDGGLTGSGLDHTLGEFVGASDDIPVDTSAAPLDDTPRSVVDVLTGAPESVCVTPSLVESDASDAGSADHPADPSVSVCASGTASPWDSTEVGAPDTATFGASATASARVLGSDIAAGGVDDSGWSGIGVPSYGCVGSSRDLIRPGAR
ncbi:hypothetical protein [Nocardia sp. CA-135398]|uniref:hypothetical protein n=1 Tax=Nocardia sp. CA-135398 TaxID=3239977 RepID=UPI003D96472F